MIIWSDKTSDIAKIEIRKTYAKKVSSIIEMFSLDILVK